MSESGLRVSQEQLIALNDEIATLVRAGVPLELGLRQLSSSVSTSLGQISQQLSRRLDLGLPLGQSLQETIPGLPRVYTAVVDAGLRSGNLPRALESMTRFVQRGSELRQQIEFAFFYPLCVLLLAYGLFLMLMLEVVPRSQMIWSGPTPINSPFVHMMLWLCRTSANWAWIPPAFVGGSVLFWIVFARNSFLPDRRPSVMLHCIPGLYGIVKLWHWSNFAELLATLLEHQVPLPDAIDLAGDATGSPLIHEEMLAVSAELRAGQAISESVRWRRQIPPYLRWSLGAAQGSQALQNALWHGAELYRNRAAFRADMIKIWLPLFLVVFLAGGAVFVYALSMALPLQALFQQLEMDSMR